MSSRPAGSLTTPVATDAPPQDAAESTSGLVGYADGAVLDGSVDRDGEGQLNAQRDAPVGGQAVLEGVMMRGVSNWAVAVRKPSEEQLSEGELSPEEAALGEIEVSTFPLDSAMKRHRLLRLPIIRGIAALGGSLVPSRVNSSRPCRPRIAAKLSRSAGCPRR